MAVFHKGTKELETERLILRRFTIGDVTQMFKNWASDAEVTKYLRWTPYTNVDDLRGYLEETIRHYKNPEMYYWAIQIKNGECIGAINAQVSDNDFRAEIAYCIGRAFWGNGYMTEAAKEVIRFLFEEVGVNRIEAYHSVNNPGSGAVMKKAGMTWEGCSKQKYYCSMGFQDCDLYGIIKEDYERRKHSTINEVVLQTERLTLRPFTKADFSALHSYASDPENVKSMVWGPNDEKASRNFLEEAEEKWKCNPVLDYEFAVVKKDSGDVIGGCGVYLNRSRSEAMLGWILNRHYWKQGYGTELAKELICFGFEDLNLHRIYATCNTENYGSYRVMENCGMRREAEFKKNRFGRVGDREVWYDEYHYAILKEEWEKNADT
jgi:ribosomal-protein-alanine N-acetyltransferase